MLWGLLVEFRLKVLCLELTSGAGWGRRLPRAGGCLQPACAQALGCPARAQHTRYLGLLWLQEEEGSAGKLLLGEPNSNEEREGMGLVLLLSSSPPQCQTHLLMEAHRNNYRDSSRRTSDLAVDRLHVPPPPPQIISSCKTLQG